MLASRQLRRSRAGSIIRARPSCSRPTIASTSGPPSGTGDLRVPQRRSSSRSRSFPRTRSPGPTLKSASNGSTATAFSGCTTARPIRCRGARRSPSPSSRSRPHTIVFGGSRRFPLDVLRFAEPARERMTVTLPQSKLDALVSRLRIVEDDLAAGPERDTYLKLSREFSELQPVVEAIKGYQAVESEITDLDAMLNDAGTDPEMRALAETEKPALQAR